MPSTHPTPRDTSILTNTSQEDHQEHKGPKPAALSAIKETTQTSHSQSQSLTSIDWTALLSRAAETHHGIGCRALPNPKLTSKHIIRGLEFLDGSWWVARVRMLHTTTTTTTQEGESPQENEENRVQEKVLDPDSDRLAIWRAMVSEYITIQAIRTESKIPTPAVHVLELDADCDVGAPFMLMGYVRGEVLSGSVPDIHRGRVLRQVARVHVRLSRLPYFGRNGLGFLLVEANIICL